MGYMTVSEARLSMAGLQPEGLSDEELQAMIEDVKTLIDTYTDNEYSFRANPRELHRSKSGRVKVMVYNKPVRVVTHYALLLATLGGNDYEWELDTLPVETPPLGDPLPHSFGNLLVNRATSMLDPTFLLTQRGIFAQALASDVWIEVSYTSGYDDGTPQADGLSLPAPSWLRGATRECLIPRIEEWIQNATVNMAGFQEVRTANALYRRPISRGQKLDWDLPPRAKRMLARKQTLWAAGAS